MQLAAPQRSTWRSARSLAPRARARIPPPDRRFVPPCTTAAAVVARARRVSAQRTVGQGSAAKRRRGLPLADPVLAPAWGGSSAKRFLAAHPFSTTPRQNKTHPSPRLLNSRASQNPCQGPAPAALAALPAGVSTPVFSELDADLAARLEKLDAKIAGAKTGVRAWL